MSPLPKTANPAVAYSEAGAEFLNLIAQAS
jgi:hypothetical protein